ncbi:hypothetical protein JOM56_013847 [Amanita muscaria]
MAISMCLDDYENKAMWSFDARELSGHVSRSCARVWAVRDLSPLAPCGSRLSRYAVAAIGTRHTRGFLFHFLVLHNLVLTCQRVAGTDFYAKNIDNVISLLRPCGYSEDACMVSRHTFQLLTYLSFALSVPSVFASQEPEAALVLYVPTVYEYVRHSECLRLLGLETGLYYFGFVVSTCTRRLSLVCIGPDSRLARSCLTT